MTAHTLDSALQNTVDLKGKVDLYNRFFAANRDDYPLDILERMPAALALSHRSVYTRGVFETLIHQAYTYLQISEKSKAEEYIGRIKQLYREDSGWNRENMYFYHLLCLYYCGKSCPGLCSDYAYRCLSLARKLNDKSMNASVQALLGRMKFKSGKYGEAEELYLRGLNKLTAEEDSLLASMINCQLGDLFAHEKKSARARCFFHRGYDLIKDRSPGSRGYAWVLRRFAAFEESVGNLATAEYLYEEAVSYLEKNGYGSLAAEFRLGLGRLLLKRGNEEGLQLLMDQRESLLSKGLIEEVLTIGDLLSDFYLEREEYQSAARELKKLRAFSRKQESSKAKTRDDSFEKEQWMTARDNLTRVHSLGSKLAACQSREDIFLVLQGALGFLGDEDGLLVVEEKSDSQLELIFGNLNRENVSPRTFPHDPNISLISYCLSNNQSLLIDNFEKERGFFMAQPGMHLELPGDYPCSLSLLNLVYERESARGVISLQSSREGQFHFHQLEFLQSLLPFITVALDNEEKTDMIRKLSTLDSLTGLMNRREFMRVMKNSWSAHGRSNDTLSLLMVDIDHFKMINDTYGHKAGDEGLVRLSRILERHFKRATDTCCRYGGEEFIILSGYTDRDTCAAKGEELRRDVEELFYYIGEDKVSFTISIGTATMVPTEETLCEDFIHMSDLSLYQAKDKGRNCVVSHDDSPVSL